MQYYNKPYLVNLWIIVKLRISVSCCVNLAPDPDTAKEELKESLLFEIEMANITTPAEERRNATTLYNPTTLG